MGEAILLRDGELATVPTLEDVESLDFPAPIGRCEAFATLGGTSTLPWTLKGRVRNLDYKTVRYPGHVDRIRLLKTLGFFDEAPVDVAGAPVSPRACPRRCSPARSGKRTCATWSSSASKPKASGRTGPAAAATR
ncbi:MAG: hypothetical protein H6694_02745 [Candidatus Latescibacteria bacterium]|nr:hypothetical protein [Candidatus Latescibacterota bacterium]